MCPHKHTQRYTFLLAHMSVSHSREQPTLHHPRLAGWSNMVETLCSMSALKPVFMCVTTYGCMRSTVTSPNLLCHSEGKWCVYMWIISSFGGELSPTVDHKLVFYFRWYTSSREHFFFLLLISIIFLVYCFATLYLVSVAMAVMCVLLKHTRTIESIFHVAAKSFQGLYQALIQVLHGPPTN